MAKNKRFKQFPITSICREDLGEAGFDASKIDDFKMKQIASKLADAYLDNGFWIDLPIVAEYLDIPQKSS